MEPNELFICPPEGGSYLPGQGFSTSRTNQTIQKTLARWGRWVYDEDESRLCFSADRYFNPAESDPDWEINLAPGIGPGLLCDALKEFADYANTHMVITGFLNKLEDLHYLCDALGDLMSEEFKVRYDPRA